LDLPKPKSAAQAKEPIKQNPNKKRLRYPVKSATALKKGLSKPETRNEKEIANENKAELSISIPKKETELPPVSFLATIP
jgi:hypothetical protein